VFSQVKRGYNRKRLNALANDKDFDQVHEIEEALKVVTTDLVAACARKSDYLLRRNLKD
jgi:hypothetical protein